MRLNPWGLILAARNNLREKTMVFQKIQKQASAVVETILACDA